MTLRAATKADLRKGAVLERDGKLWDVDKAPTAGIQWKAVIVDDYGNERDVTNGVVGHYRLVREAPCFDTELEDVASLPEVDSASDTQRRIGVLGNLEAA